MASKAAQPEAPEQLGEVDPEEAPRVAADYRIGQEKIAEIVKFHATPVVAQALREAFGWLGREAASAAKRRPRNRPADFAAWPLPALRLLAELCEAYAPETGTVAAPREPEMFPDAADAAIAAHEDAIPAVVAERVSPGTRTETLATVLDAPAEPSRGSAVWGAILNGISEAETRIMPASDPLAPVTIHVTTNDPDVIDGVMHIVHGPDAWIAPDPWIAPADWAKSIVDIPEFYAPDPWTDGEVGAGK